MAQENDRRRRLVIVESPAKARTIGQYLGKGYKVRASVGHVRDLPKRELGVDIEQGFEPKYVTIRGKGKVLKELRRDAKEDRKSTRLNSSHVAISYAVFCLKKKRRSRANDS